MTKQQLLEASASATGRFAEFAVRNLDLAAATDDDNAVWEPFQIQYLNLCEDHIAQAISKTRQCGFSWLLALEAVIRAYIHRGSLTNFVSINRDEAEEKIRYAAQINEALWPDVRLTWVTNNRGELEANNGSRIRSHASKPPRGRPKAHHRLDECAHYQRPKEIYDGAAPSLLRAGSIALASSPWVKGGFHYEVMEQPDRYPSFERMWIPWWEVRGLCADVETARAQAPALQTEERVDRFGTPRLQLLFEIMSLDSFQVECELAYADDNLAWITWEEIQACTTDPEADACLFAEGMDRIEDALQELRRRRPRGSVFAGYDVARKHDKAVLALLENRGKVFHLIGLFVLKNASFDVQRTLLERVTPLVRKGCIDATGLGANLAEDMHRYDSGWKEVIFSHPVKGELAIDLRQRFQQRTIAIPANRNLQRDLHSVHRMVTAANNTIYEVGRGVEGEVDDGHADMFWALSLAVRATAGSGWVPVPAALRIGPGPTFTGINQATGRIETVPYKLANELGPSGAPLLGERGFGAHPRAGELLRQQTEQMYPAMRMMRERLEKRREQDGWIGDGEEE